ncbi:MAG: hypothetical protein DRN15_02010 [Thermoprotei archaeon]|nr:MAG: hypothetical protein DRM97_06440 [Thermoprotei archaeon]RLF24773.1 MAG: hypothetical protein DRN15_02010 [Thermoprotei archaeon]
MKRFQCMACGNIIEVPYGMPKPLQCPRCGAPHHMIHRVDRGRGRRGWGRGRGRGGGGPPWAEKSSGE